MSKESIETRLHNQYKQGKFDATMEIKEKLKGMEKEIRIDNDLLVNGYNLALRDILKKLDK